MGFTPNGASSSLPIPEPDLAKSQVNLPTFSRRFWSRSNSQSTGSTHSFLSTISSASQSGFSASSWKGKGRLIDGEDAGPHDEYVRGASTSFRRRTERSRLTLRDEGSGANDGIVLPMDMIGSGIYDAIYTIPVRVGANRQNLSIQVDTGSSDMWFASTSCSTKACSQTGGRLYDSSVSSVPTGQEFNITYLQGRVIGPIVWDTIEIGGYSIDNQALAAADNVADEPLAPQFVGILGLALPLNSIIAGLIPPGTSNSPDGQALTPNIFSITPRSAAPSWRFISLSLSRPGSDYPPSLLGIGRHPSAIKQLHKDNDTSKDMDVGKISYSSVVAERSGVLFWKVSVRGITVWVDGAPREVALGRGASGSAWPTAVVDSGVPLILTTSAIANGIYGAIGVNPASDGQYYVPCRTPLNLTLTLDDRPSIPLHPLDLTGEPPKDTDADYCIGLIQSADAALANPESGIGDMILGVPFMRNAYSVLAYDVPDSNGTFPNTTEGSSAGAIRPRLGLLSLTDPVVAMDEFTRVRVAHQPLSTGGSSGGSKAPSSDGRKISVGVGVLIGLLGFFALCFVLFGLRWFFSRRRWRNRVGGNSSVEGGSGSGEGDAKSPGEYQLARRGSGGSVELGGVGLVGASGGKDGKDRELDEDALRQLRFEAYMRKERMHSEYTMSSGRTRVGGDDGGGGGEDAEMGFRKSKAMDGAGGEEVLDGAAMSSIGGHGDVHSANDDTWDPQAGLNWGDSDRDRDSQKHSPLHDTRFVDSSPERSRSPSRPPFRRNRANTELQEINRVSRHERGRSVSVPLLPNEDSPHYDFSTDGMDEFGVRTSMAGVGTAARTGRMESLLRQSTSTTATFMEDSHASSSSPRGGVVGSRPRPSQTPTGPRPPSSVSGSGLVAPES